MNIFLFGLAGAIAGLIVASWHGFKDAPWEGFILARFPRSILWGGIIGIFLYYSSRLGLLSINNLGIVALSTVCLERAWGELYKGFLKRRDHDEYVPVFHTYHLPCQRYIHKLLLGITLTIIIGGLLLFYTVLPVMLSSIIPNRTIIGALCGLLSGLTVALGGALKDSPSEGFLWKKFIRSPMAGLAGGLLLSSLTTSLSLLMFASIGFERITVEFYKTFYSRGVRGIFRDKVPHYQDWFGPKRWLFFTTYLFGVAFVCFSLFIPIYPR